MTRTGEAKAASLQSASLQRREKSATAFRTISEAADELGLPQHVLRFWETRFASIKPLKRGGGRRYYRPDDLALLRNIRDLLHIEGYTIKGVQKLLRQNAGKTANLAKSTTAPEKTEKHGALDAQKRQQLEAVLGELEELRSLLLGDK